MVAKKDAIASTNESLPELFGRLADDLTTLFDAKLSLLRIELREEVGTYVRGLAMTAAGAVVLLVGFALVNVGIALLVSTLFENMSFGQPVRYALGFLLTALIYIVAGAAVIIISKNRIAAQDIIPPRTVAELEKDKKFIEKEV